jgi:hypothetical protein
MILTNKRFYIADCAIEDIDMESLPQGKVDSWALGRATLASGDIELHFNWVARGGETVPTAFDFEVTLDEEQPDFELEGLEHSSDEQRESAINEILASGDWQAEVLECLPKTAAELAALQ